MTQKYVRDVHEAEVLENLLIRLKAGVKCISEDDELVNDAKGYMKGGELMDLPVSKMGRNITTRTKV